MTDRDTGACPPAPAVPAPRETARASAASRLAALITRAVALIRLAVALIRLAVALIRLAVALIRLAGTQCCTGRSQAQWDRIVERDASRPPGRAGIGM
jgi:hypothetical protein